MTTLLKVYTADQLYTLYRNKILADNCGLTDFNDGSKTKSLIQSNSDIVSAISMDFKQAIYNAIPIALYQGFGFKKKVATSAVGYIRPYRKPTFTLNYTGAGSSAQITITATTISAAVTGAPGDAFTLAFATYTTVGALVTAINLIGNWAAVGVSSSAASTGLYQQAGTEVIGALNYLYQSGLDIMLQSDIAVTIPTGYSVTLNQQVITTTADGTILAGTSGIQIAAQNTTTGAVGNIGVGAIDTLNGLGYINSVVQGVQYVKNDTAFASGTDQESDTARKIRFIATINALNAGTKNGLIVEIEKINSVRSVGMITSYPAIGMNTIIVDDGTSTVSASLLAEIMKIIEGDPTDMVNYPGKGTAGIGYSVIAPTIVSSSVTLTAKVLADVIIDYTTLATNIQTAVEQYINSLTLGRDVIVTEIIRVVKNVSSAVYDVEITLPTVNIPVLNTEFARTGAGTSGVVTVSVISQQTA